MMDIVLVEWIDSNAWYGWKSKVHAVEEVRRDTLKCVSVGMVLYEDDERLVLSQSLSLEGEKGKERGISSVSGRLAIPQSAIKRVVKLKEK